MHAPAGVGYALCWRRPDETSIERGGALVNQIRIAVFVAVLASLALD